MRVHVLERSQRVPLSVDDAFAFYGDGGQPGAHHASLAAVPDPGPATRRAVERGRGCEYSLVLHRFPVRWTTEIRIWEPPHHFVDFQVRGPYRMWEHTHTFQAVDGGTVIADRIRYAIPYGPLGALAHVAFVRRDLRRIFDYRRDAVAALLA